MTRSAVIVAGKKMKDLRKLAGKTQTEVSRDLGITEGFLSFLESGSKTGSLDTYISIANYFNFPLSDLFDQEKEVKQNAFILGGLTSKQLKLIKDLIAEFKR
jgi:putative transcriptional regulator